jgi:hypothetical protein
MEWLQSHLSAGAIGALSQLSMFGEELLMIVIMGFFYWCYDKEFGKFIGMNFLVANVWNPMIKNIALRLRPYFCSDRIDLLRLIDSKADKFEFQVLEFIRGILQIAGIEDSPTFNRSQITNTNEEIQVILQAAQYLPETYVTKKIVSMLGDNEALEDILADIDNENMDRLTPEEEEGELPEPAGFIGKGEPLTRAELEAYQERQR